MNGYYTVNVAVASTDEEWYPIQIVNVRTEGYGNGTISFGEGQYKQFKGRTYLKAGSSVTVTAVPDGESEFVSAEFGKNVYFDNPFTFVMPEEFSEITIVWQQKAEKFITVYSEVSFTYNGNSFGGSENNEYLLYESVVGEGQNTLGASVAVDAGYYFLGWAVSNGDALEFVTATVDYEKEGISYYAIWAYNGSQTLTVNNVTNSSSSLPADISAAQGSFYAWYTSRTENPETGEVIFSGEAKTLENYITVYYARLSFNFSYKVGTPNGASNVYENNVRIEHNTNNMHSFTISVYEGDIVTISGLTLNGTAVVDYSDSNGSLIVKEYTAFKTKWDWGNYSDDKNKPRLWKIASGEYRDNDHSYGGENENWSYNADGTGMSAIVNCNLSATING